MPGEAAAAVPPFAPTVAPVSQTIYVESQSQALPALASFFCPGLGQLIQGRLGAAACFFFGSIFAALSIFILVGLILYPAVMIWSIIDAANWKPRARHQRYR